jgi:hypothetical protein
VGVVIVMVVVSVVVIVGGGGAGFQDGRRHVVGGEGPRVSAISL